MTMSKKHEQEHNCPECDTVLKVLLFMGEIPDGYVCPKCKLYYPPKDDGSPEEKPRAVVI